MGAKPIGSTDFWMSIESGMEFYTNISRKFRPQRFADVCQQKAVVQTLKNAISMDRIAHAYLFCGGRGCGKTTLARLFAKAINCSQLQNDTEPCNECSSCREIASGQSLDVIEIDGASNRGIEDIRQINETIGYAATGGKNKIYIIDEVHMLTKEAFNALLKTLEEPPSHVRFFFATTEPHKIPLTILSRCQRFDLSRIQTEAILSKLTQICSALSIDVEEQALAMIARRAEGSLRDAESYLDQLLCYHKPPISYQDAVESLGLIDQQHLFAFDRFFESGDLTGAFSTCNALLSTTTQHHFILETLLQHFRNLIQLKLNYPHAILPHYLDTYQEHTKLYSLEQLIRISSLIAKETELAYKTPYKSFHLEILLLQVIQSKKSIDYPQLVQRLEELEQKLSDHSPSKNSVLEKPPEYTPPLASTSQNAQEIDTSQASGSAAIESQNTSSATAKAAAPMGLQQSTAAAEAQKQPSAVVQTAPLQKPSHPSASPKASSASNISPSANLEAMQKKSSSQEAEKPVDSIALSQSLEQRQKHERLLRFAAVELNGAVKK